MKEKNIQYLFGKNNKIQGFFELKLAKTTRLPYNAVKPHQLEALTQGQIKGIYHKISDSPWTQAFTLAKPFDCFFVQANAYVVVCWYTPRAKKLFTYIPILRWLEAEATSDRKSITREEAEAIATHYLVV